MNDNIKQDINFLEYPLWMQSSQTADGKVVTWEDREGYKFEASRGVPSKVDMLFLYYIMLESQNNNWDNIVRISRYQILNACGMNPSKEKRDRLIKSLEAWKRVTISFSGTFYSGTGYEFLEFGIINDWGIRESDKKLEIELNRKWIEKIKQSEFFKYLSFGQMKQLRSPLALRLYEILSKTFYKRLTWEIDVFKLAEKIPMAEKYIAHIIPKIEAATKRIREKTDLDITVKVVKQERGQGKFIFTKKEKKVKSEVKESSYELLPPAPLPEPQPSVLKTPQLTQPQPPTPPPSFPIEILNLIPEEWRDNALSEAERIWKLSGEETLKRCIQKINHSIKKGTEIGSYGGYLRRCYDEKWYEHKSAEEIKAEKAALAHQKAELLRQKEKEERRRKEEHERLKRNFDEEISQLAVARFEQLSPTKQAQMIEEFEHSMNSATKARYLDSKKVIDNSLIVKSQFNLLLRKHLLSEDEISFDLWLESRRS